jgi:hypothetical protein
MFGSTDSAPSPFADHPASTGGGTSGARPPLRGVTGTGTPPPATGPASAPACSTEVITTPAVRPAGSPQRPRGHGCRAVHPGARSRSSSRTRPPSRRTGRAHPRRIVTGPMVTSSGSSHSATMTSPAATTQQDDAAPRGRPVSDHANERVLSADRWLLTVRAWLGRARRSIPVRLACVHTRDPEPRPDRRAWRRPATVDKRHLWTTRGPMERNPGRTVRRLG